MAQHTKPTDLGWSLDDAELQSLSYVRREGVLDVSSGPGRSLELVFMTGVYSPDRAVKVLFTDVVGFRLQECVVQFGPFHMCGEVVDSEWLKELAASDALPPRPMPWSWRHLIFHFDGEAPTLEVVCTGVQVAPRAMAGTEGLRPPGRS